MCDRFANARGSASRVAETANRNRRLIFSFPRRRATVRAVWVAETFETRLHERARTWTRRDVVLKVKEKPQSASPFFLVLE